MNFLTGNLSLKRFFIEDIGFFKDNRKELIERMAEYKFIPIDDSASEETVGWTPRSDRPELNSEDIILGSLIFLSMRIDTKTVSKDYVTFKTLEKIRKHSLTVKSKTDFKNLKEDVRYDLIKKTTPNPKLIEGVVDLENSTLYICSSSKKMVGYFLSLFNKTFDMKPAHIDATGFATISVKDHEMLEEMSNLGEEVYCEC